MTLSRKLLAAAVLAALSTPAFAEITIDVAGGSEISFEGLFQADYAMYDNDVANLSGRPLDGDDDFEMRRAEVILKGKGPGMWNWVIGYDAKADKWLDVNVGYRWGGFTTLTVGQYKQPNSLEELTSTRFNDFISKAMTTNMQGVAAGAERDTSAARAARGRRSWSRATCCTSACRRSRWTPSWRIRRPA